MVKEVKPVPPLVVANVPERLTAPDVAVLGVKPVVPALKLETPNDERFSHVGADAPLLCKICPAVPAAVNA